MKLKGAHIVQNHVISRTIITDHMMMMFSLTVTVETALRKLRRALNIEKHLNIEKCLFEIKYRSVFPKSFQSFI